MIDFSLKTAAYAAAVAGASLFLAEPCCQAIERKSTNKKIAEYAGIFFVAMGASAGVLASFSLGKVCEIALKSHGFSPLAVTASKAFLIGFGSSFTFTVFGVAWSNC